MIKWINTKPIDIYKKDLSKYFYLTRDSLNNNYQEEQFLSVDEKNQLNLILTSPKVLLKKNVENLKNLKYDISHILTTLLEKFQRKEIDIMIIAAIYEIFSEYRSNICTIISNLTGSYFKPAALVSLANMIKIDSTELVDAINKNEKIDSQFKKQLFQKIEGDK